MGYDVQQSLGDHDVTVESHSITEKEPGVLVVSLRLKFSDGELGSKDLYPLASEKSLQITRKTLRAMGFDMDKRDLGELNKNGKLLAGAKVRAVVEENEFNGKITNRISWINAIPKPPSQDALKDLQAKLRNVKNDNAEEAL
jgi:hypothetical protein